MKRNFHVVLIPFSLILNFYALNIGKISFQHTYRSLLITLTAAIIFFIILKIALTSAERAAVLESVFFLLFFHFNSISTQILHILKRMMIFENPAYPQVSLYVGIILAILFLLFVMLVLRNDKFTHTISHLANLFSILLVSIILGTLGFFIIQKNNPQGTTKAEKFNAYWQTNLKSEGNYFTPTDKAPDIYYIVLDGYGRDDALDQYYGIKQKPFLDSLDALGFTVAQNSLANYKQTHLSIASLLNMEYLTRLEESFGNSFDYEPLNHMIRNNRVIEQLRRVGYRIDTFSSGLEATENMTSSQIYHPPLDINDFEMLIITSTPLGSMMNNGLHAIHRERVLYALNNIAQAGSQPGPDFVFAHILAPHPPFVFGPNGESVTPNHPYSTSDASDFMKFGTAEEYQIGYANQIAFINDQVLIVIQEILRESDTPPIIILQGDHGPGAKFDHLILETNNLSERYPILFAANIPCGSDYPIPDDITPVNSFRYIFNACFDTDLPILENRSYFSSTLTPYLFTDVTNYIH